MPKEKDTVIIQGDNDDYKIKLYRDRKCIIIKTETESISRNMYRKLLEQYQQYPHENHIGFIQEEDNDR